MKIFIITLIAIFIVSCNTLSKDKYYVRMTGSVEISHTEVPDTVLNNSTALIKAKSQANNGCWKDLYFTLTKSTDFEYDLQAFGTYESFGTCPDVMVYGDTTLSWKPTLTGLYKFYIYKGPDDTEIDTLIVK